MKRLEWLHDERSRKKAVMKATVRNLRQMEDRDTARGSNSNTSERPPAGTAAVTTVVTPKNNSNSEARALRQV